MGIVLTDFSIGGQDDIVKFQNIKAMVRIDSSSRAVSHDLEARICVSFDLSTPLSQKRGAGDEQCGLVLGALAGMSVDDVG